MAKPRDIIAEILSEIPTRARPGRWHERVNDEQRQIVDVIATAWLAGDLGPAARPVAPAIARKLQQAGVNVTANTVREWLADMRKS